MKGVLNLFCSKSQTMSSRKTAHEQSICISNAFVSTIETSASDIMIPESIIDLISSFVGDLLDNQGSYTWKISDPLMVNQILHTENGTKFTSNPFTISRIRCELDIYPNGNTPDLSGYFVIFLRLISLPKYVKSVTASRIFRVLENQTSAAYVDDISIDTPDYWTDKCPLSELVAINPDTMSVQVELFILKIMFSDKNALENCPLSLTSIIPDKLTRDHHLECIFYGYAKLY